MAKWIVEMPDEWCVARCEKCPFDCKNDEFEDGMCCTFPEGTVKYKPTTLEQSIRTLITQADHDLRDVKTGELKKPIGEKQ